MSNSGWLIDFEPKPLDIWAKHERLKCEWVEGNITAKEARALSEKQRKGLAIRLVFLSKSFVIGRLMLFRVEIRNISDETVGYMHFPVLFTDPMVAIPMGACIWQIIGSRGVLAGLQKANYESSWYSEIRNLLGMNISCKPV